MTSNDSQPLFLRADHDGSGRAAVIDEVEGSVWLYLMAAGENRPERDCWLANTVAHEDQLDMAHYRAVGAPPPAAPRIVGEGAILAAPGAHEWSLQWSRDGEAVAAVCDGQVRGFICARTQTARARHLVADGPWGQAWEQREFDERFR